MVEEVVSIIDDIQGQCSKDDEFTELSRQKVAMYLDLIKDTMQNQHKIIVSYENITKKLETQISDC